MKQTRIFTSFLKQLRLTNTTPPPSYMTTPSTIQSSIGIIFKCTSTSPQQSPSLPSTLSAPLSSTPSPLPTSTSTRTSTPPCSSASTPQMLEIEHLLQKMQNMNNISVLMVQRGGYEKDVNAYNIVFPGGQADPSQTDLQACKRQLLQQINLEVDRQCYYMGKIPKNFYYSRKKNKYMYITCNVWLLKPQSTYQPLLNPDQLVHFRWVPLLEFVDPGNLNIFDAKREFGLFRRLPWRWLRDSACFNVETVKFASLDLKMNRDLWGLTLWLVSYMLQMSQHNLRTTTPTTPQSQTLCSQIHTIITRIKHMEITFNRRYLLGRPMTFLARGWHYIYRSRQFTYKGHHCSSGSGGGYVPIVVMLMIALMTVGLYMIICGDLQ